MTSDTHAFVWVWLPGATEPVIAGRLDQAGPIFEFVYGRSYLDLPGGTPLYLPDLPLIQESISPLGGAEAPGPILDAAPEAWGQRVIESRIVGRDSDEDLGLLTYLLESGSDRIGALDFTRSSSDYIARATGTASLDDLLTTAELLDQRLPIPASLRDALLHGSSIGGARPKALLDDGDRKLIAKFSSTSDAFPIVRAEFVAMELARRSGLNVAAVEHTKSLGKDVLLVERFDRTPGGGRRFMVSGTTMVGLDPRVAARYGSYAEMADLIVSRFTNAEETLRELFSRIVFNILVGNTDDHLRNHSAFWDGRVLTLTPAYDLTPQTRSGGEAVQAMAIGRDGYRFSQIAGAVKRATPYHLTERDARDICDHQIEVIRREVDEVCDLAELTKVEREGLWGRQFLNPYAMEGY
jgi:serine/threonine-protein kinase HipA